MGHCDSAEAKTLGATSGKYLETNEAVLHNVNTPDAVLPGHDIQSSEQLYRAFAYFWSVGEHFDARWQP